MLLIDRLTATITGAFKLGEMRPKGRRVAQLLGAFALLFVFSGAAHAQTVNLAWNANTESDLAGYRVYYGTSSAVYTNNINVGNVTAYTVTGLNIGQPYYFAIKAYNTAGTESV